MSLLRSLLGGNVCPLPPGSVIDHLEIAFDHCHPNVWRDQSLMSDINWSGIITAAAWAVKENATLNNRPNFNTQVSS